ncbi:hypothetical protein [Catellatospora citrea]|uniref:hypothetical protein n=1 Tax=Catellatospora citrea TaxID=53366 RepID=UPI001942D5D7|nr:hypothetical protein [Catellatospora citrea]
MGMQRVSLAASQALFRQGPHDERLVQDTVFRVGHVEQIITFDSRTAGAQVRHDYLLVQDQTPTPVQPTEAAPLPVPATLWQQPTLYQILYYDDLRAAGSALAEWITTLAASTALAPRLGPGRWLTLEVSAQTADFMHAGPVAGHVARRLQAALPGIHVTTGPVPDDIVTGIAPGGRVNGLVIVRRGADAHTPPPGHQPTTIPGNWAQQNPTSQSTRTHTATGFDLLRPPATGPVTQPPDPPAPAGTLGPHTADSRQAPPPVPSADAIDLVVDRFLAQFLNSHRPDLQNDPTHHTAAAPHASAEDGLAWVPQLHTDLTTAHILTHPQTPGIVQLAAGTRALAGNPDTTPTIGIRANLTMLNATTTDGTHRLLTTDTVFTIGRIDLVTTPHPDTHTLTTRYDYHLTEDRTTPPTDPAHLQPLTPPPPTHPALRHILRSHHPLTGDAITAWTRHIATTITDPHTNHQPRLQITAHTPHTHAHYLAQAAAIELRNFLMEYYRTYYPDRPLPDIIMATAYPTTPHHQYQITVSHNPTPHTSSHQVDPRSV